MEQTSAPILIWLYNVFIQCVWLLGDEAGLKPLLVLGQLPSTPDELLKLDQVFVKSELKVGVIYIKGNQVNSEESILGNRHESDLFREFLNILGERIRLKGFDKYKGGLDTGKDDSLLITSKSFTVLLFFQFMIWREPNQCILATKILK